MHTYKCASCGLLFHTENYAEKCPECRCRILIHKDGEPRKKKNCTCSGGSCSSCASPCSCH